MKSVARLNHNTGLDALRGNDSGVIIRGYRIRNRIIGKILRFKLGFHIVDRLANVFSDGKAVIAAAGKILQDEPGHQEDCAQQHADDNGDEEDHKDIVLCPGTPALVNGVLDIAELAVIRIMAHCLHLPCRGFSDV